jgi:hypothetical protein
MDTSISSGDNKHLVFHIHRIYPFREVQLSRWSRRSQIQYRTVLSHDPVTIMGDSEFGRWENRSARIGESWLPTICGAAPLAPRSRSRTFLSAPAPATFWPS